MQKIVILLSLLLIGIHVKAQNVVDFKGTKHTADTTADGWKNDPANTQVKLGYNSDGATARPDSTAFVAKDNGWVGIGLINPSGILDIKGKIYVNNQQTVYNAAALDANFIGSLFIGNGGANSSFTSGAQGQSNTAVGIDALLSQTTGDGNTAIGNLALNANTSGRLNTATGLNTLLVNSTGTGNSGYGVNSLMSNTTGNYNIAYGGNSLISNISGSRNTAVGYSALSLNTATGNTGVGGSAGATITTGANNTVIGYYPAPVGTFITTGTLNTILGYNTGIGITTGARNTILGAGVSGLPATLSNNIILADGAGNRRINVDATGRTGIGTISPTARLSVLDSSSATFFQIADFFAPVNTTAGNSTLLKLGVAAANNNSSEIRFNYQGDGLTTNRLDFGFHGTAAPRLSILAGGNVGIGTTAPVATLDINGTERIAVVNNMSNDTLYKPLVWNTVTKMVHAATSTNNIAVTTASVAAAGSSGTIYTMTSGAAYEVKVYVETGCSGMFYNKFFVVAANLNNNSALNYVGGVSQNGAPSTTTGTNKTTAVMLNPYMGGCASAPGTTDFNYTISVGANTGELSITNNGSSARTYRLIIEKVFD